MFRLVAGQSLTCNNAGARIHTVFSWASRPYILPPQTATTTRGFGPQDLREFPRRSLVLHGRLAMDQPFGTPKRLKSGAGPSQNHYIIPLVCVRLHLTYPSSSLPVTSPNTHLPTAAVAATASATSAAARLRRGSGQGCRARRGRQRGPCRHPRARHAHALCRCV